MVLVVVRQNCQTTLRIVYLFLVFFLDISVCIDHGFVIVVYTIQYQTHECVSFSFVRSDYSPELFNMGDWRALVKD